MAEITRYQRSEAAQAVPTSKAEANNLQSLAERLRSFSERQFDRQAQQAAIEGEQAGQLAASGRIGGLDLSDNSTIRSRAFNKGAQLSHAAAIKVDINENISRLKMENPYDVAAFTEKAAGYKKGLLSKVDSSLYALAEADLNTAISNGTIIIGEDFMKMEQKNQVATIQKGVAVSEELILQLSAKGDIEGAEDQMAQVLTALNEGVALNLPGLDQAFVDDYMMKLSELSDSELILGTFKRELEANGIEAAQTALDAFDSYTDTLIDDEGNEVSIRPDTKRKIVTSMNTLINREQADQNAIDSAAKAQQAAIKKVLQDEVTQHIKALDLNQFPDSLEELKKQLVQFPDLEKDLLRAEAEAAAAAVFMTQAPGVMEIAISDMTKEKNLSPARAQLLERFKKIFADTTARMNTDMLNLAVEQGILTELTNINFADPNSIKDRVLQYRTAQDHYGVSGGSPLTAFETKTLVDRLSDTETPSNDKMFLLTGLVDGFGPASTDLFENMFGESAPEYIMVGELISESRSTGNQGVFNTGEKILQGMELMDKGLVVVESDLENNILIELGEAAQENPDYAQMVVQSVKALYVNANRGTSGETVGMEDEILKYLEEVTGGVIEYNGTKIITPKRGITEKMFETKIENLTRNDLNAMGGVDLSRYTAAEALEIIQDDGRFKSVGQGKYVVVISEEGDPGPEEVLRNKFYETFIFNFDTAAGIKDSWSEDGFSVDYKKLEEEEKVKAEAKKEAEKEKIPTIKEQKDLIDPEQKIGLFTVPDEED